MMAGRDGRWIRATLLAGMVGIQLPACVVYERDWRGGDRCPAGPCETDPWAGDSGLPEEPELSYQLDLDPAEGSPGEVLIASLRVTGDLGVQDIHEVQFLDDRLDVLASEARQSEWLLTISVAEEAEAGAVDALLVRDQAEPILFADAFTIRVAESPESGDSGGAQDSGELPCDTGS